MLKFKEMSKTLQGYKQVFGATYGEKIKSAPDMFIVSDCIEVINKGLELLFYFSLNLFCFNLIIYQLIMQSQLV